MEPRHQRGEPFIDVEAWKACEHDETPPGPLVVALEDYFGHGSSVALAGELDDGRIYIETETFDNPTPARQGIRPGGQAARPLRLLAAAGGANLNDPRAAELGAEKAGSEETAIGLPLWRSLLAEGRLVHYISDALTEQLAAARVTRTSSGQLSFVPGTRTDAIRATRGRLLAEQDPPAVPQIFSPRSRERSTARNRRDRVTFA